MMKTKRYFPCTLLALALAGVLCGCSKESPAEVAGTESELTPVNFVAQIAGETRATTPLPQDAFVGMAVLQRKDAGTPERPNPLTTTPIYKNYTLGATALAPYADEKPLSLVKGTYDFYAVAENKGNGQLTKLETSLVETNAIEVVIVENGRDYVGATLQQVAVAGSTAKTLTLTFDHLATKIDLALAKDASIATLAISNVAITPSSGSDFIISHAELIPVLTPGSISGLGVTVNMTEVTANALYSYIMQPADTGTLKFTITAQVTPTGAGAVAESRTYMLEYPLGADKKLLGRKMYKMKATIGLYTVTFDGTGPNVEDWTEGNSETPVTPSEQ